MVHHMFHKHGVEIEGIIKCPNEWVQLCDPSKVHPTIPTLTHVVRPNRTKNTNAQNMERATDQRNI